jgi:hypothetical protein
MVSCGSRPSAESASQEQKTSRRWCPHHSPSNIREPGDFAVGRCSGTVSILAHLLDVLLCLDNRRGPQTLLCPCGEATHGVAAVDLVAFLPTWGRQFTLCPNPATAWASWGRSRSGEANKPSGAQNLGGGRQAPVIRTQGTTGQGLSVALGQVSSPSTENGLAVFKEVRPSGCPLSPPRSSLGHGFPKAKMAPSGRQHPGSQWLACGGRRWVRNRAGGGQQGFRERPGKALVLGHAWALSHCPALASCPGQPQATASSRSTTPSLAYFQEPPRHPAGPATPQFWRPDRCSLSTGPSCAEAEARIFFFFW